VRPGDASRRRATLHTDSWSLDISVGITIPAAMRGKPVHRARPRCEPRSVPGPLAFEEGLRAIGEAHPRCERPNPRWIPVVPLSPPGPDRETVQGGRHSHDMAASEATVTKEPCCRGPPHS